MFRTKITNSKDHVIFTNLDESCDKCCNSCSVINEIINICPVFKNKRRRGKIAVEGIGGVYLCTAENDYLKSSRLFKEKMTMYEMVLKEIILIKDTITEAINKDSKRLIHNLTSLNAHNIQELYNVVPQDILTQDYRDQINIIKDTVKSNSDKTAEMFIRIAKNNSAMKTEFAVFKKLYEPNALLHPKRHTVRKVLLNVLHTFFQDFTDQGIYVEVKDDNETLEFDYETIHVGLYHILENATKYAASDSRITIFFRGNPASFDIVFEMLSIQIGHDEIPMILQEGGRGRFAKLLNKPGGGIGLSHVTRILKLINAELVVNRNVKPRLAKNILGNRYEINQFIIRFNDITTLNKR